MAWSIGIVKRNLPFITWLVQIASKNIIPTGQWNGHLRSIYNYSVVLEINQRDNLLINALLQTICDGHLRYQSDHLTYHVTKKEQHLFPCGSGKNRIRSCVGKCALYPTQQKTQTPCQRHLSIPHQYQTPLQQLPVVMQKINEIYPAFYI